MSKFSGNIDNRVIQNVYIDSADRQYGSPSDFGILINDLTPRSSKIDIGVVSVVIPYTYYNLNVHNNILGLSTSGINYAITMPYGSYTAPAFTSMLNTQMGATIASMTSSISATTGQLSIGSTNISFSITAPKFMGTLNDSTSYNVLNAGDTLTLPFPVNLAGTSYLDIVSDIGINSTNSGNNNRNLLARVPVNCVPLSTIFYDNSAYNYINLKADNINSARFTLLDSDENVVDLNNFDWQLCLELSTSDV